MDTGKDRGSVHGGGSALPHGRPQPDRWQKRRWLVLNVSFGPHPQSTPYRVRYPGATRKHVEPSWGHVQIFRTVPFANTLVRRVGKNAFAVIMPARPCPVFGRPIHRGAAPLITARYFSASPSDSTSRWTPCPPVCLSTASRLSSTLGCFRRFRLRARLGSRLSAHPGQ